MLRARLSFVLPLVIIPFILGFGLYRASLAQEWEVRRQRGTLKVVDLFSPEASAMVSYAEGLVTLDKDNNWTPCLAEDWRRVDDRTIEFALRKGVTFQNGEKFNAEAVKINWEQYKKMACPRPLSFLVIPDETAVETIDENTVRFTFPEPEGLAFLKLRYFLQFAPTFFRQHGFRERSWGYLSEPGPWGTGPFRLVKGSVLFGKPSESIVLESYRDYWDRPYPKVERVIFENHLIGDRDEAMRLCRETEGAADIVSFIRPLDTLKVAESTYAKVVKSKDVALLYGRFNQRKEASKWRDVRLRKAVNYAINREELWKYAAKGNAYNLGGFIPPGALGHDPDLAPYTYDTDKARALLAGGGYPDGFDLELITSEAWKLEAQIIARMLERVNLKVKLGVFTWPEFLRKIWIPALEGPAEQQTWDISIGNHLDYYGHTGASLLGWASEQSDFRWSEYDPVYEAMWRAMVKTVDKGAQEDRIRTMAKYLYDKANDLFIYSPLSLYAVNKEVNFSSQRFCYLRLKDISVTDNHWSLRDLSR